MRRGNLERSSIVGRRLAAVLCSAALLVAGAAFAADASSRTEYVTRLEKICEPEALATQRVMKGARADVRKERFAAAAGKFAKAATIFGGTVKQIGVVPRPHADATKLGKWFGYLGRQESYLRKITTSLRADKGIQAQRLTARFIHTGNLANNVVLAFGFNFCSFKFSRYG